MCAMFFFRWKLDKLRDTMDKKEKLWVEEKKVRTKPRSSFVVVYMCMR